MREGGDKTSPFFGKETIMVVYKTGDILSQENTTTVIGHQVNCMGAFGAGLAKQIRSKYPNAYGDYATVCGMVQRDKLLGQCILSLAKGPYAGHPQARYVAHLFGQYRYGRGECFTDYTALRAALTSLHGTAKKFGYSVSLPFGIGCGLAGGDWNIVSAIIQEVFTDDVVCEIWKMPTA